MPTCCGRSCAGVGTRHTPFGLRALLSVSRRKGGVRLPGGGALPCRSERLQGLGPLSVLAVHPWGRQRRPDSRVSLVWGVQVLGPSTGRTDCALGSWPCALWGWQGGLPTGGAPCLREWRLELGPHTPPSACPGTGSWGPLPTFCGCECAGVVTRHWPLAFCALLGIPGGESGGRFPGGALPGWVALGWALSIFRPSVLGAGGQGPLPVFPGRRCCGSAGTALSPQHALWRAGVARFGGGRRASPGQGVPRAIVRGVLAQALTLSVLPVLGAGSWRPLPTCSLCRCAGLGTRHGPFGLQGLAGGWQEVAQGGYHLAVVSAVWG